MNKSHLKIRLRVGKWFGVFYENIEKKKGKRNSAKRIGGVITGIILIVVKVWDAWASVGRGII